MSIVSNLLPLSSVDIIAVFDADGNQVLVGDSPRSETFGFSVGTFLGGQLKAQPMRGFINRDTKGFTHQLENNLSITDHRILLPIVIDMKFLIAKDKTSVIYKELEELFVSGAEVAVKTKARLFEGLYISSIPHAETPEKFNSLEVDVKFREIQVPSGTVSFSPADANQQDTIERGELNAQVQ